MIPRLVKTSCPLPPHSWDSNLIPDPESYALPLDHDTSWNGLSKYLSLEKWKLSVNLWYPGLCWYLAIGVNTSPSWNSCVKSFIPVIPILNPSYNTGRYFIGNQPCLHAMTTLEELKSSIWRQVIFVHRYIGSWNQSLGQMKCGALSMVVFEHRLDC